ncbi:CBS domain-containing protein [Salinigranum marinum]|uniref:CBS domain-containing protein n=1 Tax=Salinigranum marinum TaxID=1515595 RepID=UPI002989CB36|nr:CBS domain-containing protein [Salinigranum marinum]
MDIEPLVSTAFETVDADTRVSKLAGTFEESRTRAVVVLDGDSYLGVVTVRQLGDSHRAPDAKVRGIVWHPATVGRDADVRAVARAMVASRSEIIPVMEDEELFGIVTADDLLAAVEEFLGVLTVADVYTPDVVTVSSGTTFGEALHACRQHRVTHLPVVDGDEAVGVVSLYDLLAFTTRSVERGTGGAAEGFDAHGGEASQPGYRSHGGFGERAGDLDRLLDLPVADVMSAPAVTTVRATPLDEAVREMLDAGISSLVVLDEDVPAGIVTKTDVLESLTWTGESRPPVQITNVDLLDDITRAEVVDLVEGVTRKYGDLGLLEARVSLHEHDETLRGTPLIMARIRLFTDRGHFVGTGEGYGASHALHLARNVVERQLLDGKSHDETKKHPDEEYWSKVFGWWLTAPPRRR